MLTFDQLKIRQTGITATDMAVIAGVQHFASAANVYESKFFSDEYLRQLVRKANNSEQAMNGHFFENAIAQRYAYDLPFQVAIAEHKKTFRSAENEWALATPDRFVYQGPEADLRADQGDAADWLLECKLVGSRMAYDWANTSKYVMSELDRIPAYVYTQAQWQMKVLAYDRCDVAALIDGTSFFRFSIEKYDDYINSLTKIAEDFWNNNVLKRRPPDPDGTRNYTRFLQRRFPSATIGMLTEVPKGGIQLAQRYEEFRKKEKEAKLEKDKCGQALRIMVGSSAGFKGQWGVVKTYDKKGDLDFKAFIKNEGISEETIKKYRQPPSRLLYIKVKGNEHE